MLSPDEFGASPEVIEAAEAEVDHRPPPSFRWFSGRAWSGLLTRVELDPATGKGTISLSLWKALQTDGPPYFVQTYNFSPVGQAARAHSLASPGSLAQRLKVHRVHQQGGAMSLLITVLRGTEKGLVVLILGMLASLAFAQEYPQNPKGGSAAAGRAGSSWFLVVSVVGQNQAATDAKGPIVEVIVDEVIDYTTEVTREDHLRYPSSFLEKVGSQASSGTIVVGEKLLVQWPSEQLLSDPEVCSKCQGDVAFNWPSDFVDERDIAGFCGVCGDQWEEADEGATPWQRQEHEVACQKDGELPQKFCSLCGEELIPQRQVCIPPAGKWIVGGHPGGSSGQNKAFSLDGYYMHYSPSVASDLLRTLGSWEQENRINTSEQDTEEQDNDSHWQQRWGD